MTQAYENDRENSINSIQNMMMSAQLIEETEAAKGSDGLNIICAYYGAIENSVDPNVSILDIVLFVFPHNEAFGPVLDVKIPLLCMMENSKIIHHGNAIAASSPSERLGASADLVLVAGVLRLRGGRGEHATHP